MDYKNNIENQRELLQKHLEDLENGLSNLDNVSSINLII